MKRWISMLLVLLMIFSLAACKPQEAGAPEDKADTAEAPKDDKPEEKAPEAGGLKGEISVQVEEGWKPYYEKAVERVKAQNPDANIKLVTMGAFDHLDIIDSTNADNPDVADVFAYPFDRVFGLHKNEVLGAFNAAALAEKIGGWKDFAGATSKYLQFDGDYFGITMNLETLINFVNKKNAEAAGLDYMKPMEFKDLDANALLTQVFNAWFGVSFTNSADIVLLGKDGDKLMSDFEMEWAELPAEKQAVVEALFNYWKAHYVENQDSLFDEAAAGGYINEQFKSGGSAVLVIEGPWSTGSLSELANNGEDLDVIPLTNVSLNGKPLSHWKGGWALGINARIEEDQEKLALAEAVMAELLNPEFAVDFFKATGKIMENVEASVYESSDLSEIDKKVITSVIKSYEEAADRPVFDEWGKVWDTYKNGMLAWNNTRPADVEAAYKDLQASFKAMMDSFQ